MSGDVDRTVKLGWCWVFVSHTMLAGVGLEPSLRQGRLFHLSPGDSPWVRVRAEQTVLRNRVRQPVSVRGGRVPLHGLPARRWTLQAVSARVAAMWVHELVWLRLDLPRL
jgi:hypothetical protein